MIRRDYVLIAEAIAASRVKLMHATNIFTGSDVIDLVALELNRNLSRDNPKFTASKFLKASGVKDGRE